MNNEFVGELIKDLDMDMNQEEIDKMMQELQNITPTSQPILHIQNMRPNRQQNIRLNQ